MDGCVCVVCVHGYVTTPVHGLEKSSLPSLPSSGYNDLGRPLKFILKALGATVLSRFSPKANSISCLKGQRLIRIIALSSKYVLGMETAETLTHTDTEYTTGMCMWRWMAAKQFSVLHETYKWISAYIMVCLCVCVYSSNCYKRDRIPFYNKIQCDKKHFCAGNGVSPNPITMQWWGKSGNQVHLSAVTTVNFMMDTHVQSFGWSMYMWRASHSANR